MIQGFPLMRHVMIEKYSQAYEYWEWATFADDVKSNVQLTLCTRAAD